ncbi:MAG: M20/M25/M40 family metallo-hydrolase [Deltaproteobacteria bacterium]|jgi:tripeptide aminopeptidase|nr:M20/M25/M40 family metallo-hydrolase [Deltaproteobacteria bacterium]
MINSQRLADEFAQLAAINSPPLKESAIAQYLKKRFETLGAEVVFDESANKTGGEVGNMIAYLPSTCLDKEPLLFSVHMDTVDPCGMVVPVLKDGVFSSAGQTILGADDKAGIAEIIETLEIIREQKIPHGEIEVVITVAEEIGLVGAKHLNYELLRSRRGIALDTPGVDWMVLKAPGANRIKAEILGRESHAGVAPEQGVSAILTAGLALSRMRLGRIDFETTANIGTIHGGVARNIVPRHVYMEGEARSHDPVKLKAQTEHMIECLHMAADAMACEIDNETFRPQLKIDMHPDYPSMAVSEDAEIVTLIKRTAAKIGHDLKIRVGGGGSDANMFNANGIETIILGTGMQNVHSVNEKVAVADMVHVVELLVAIIKDN